MVPDVNAATSSAARDDAAGRRRMVAAILLLVVGFLLVVLFRWEIRARWWAYRLDRSVDAEGRLYYVRCLAGAGEAALPSVEGLLESPDAGIRSHVVAILNNIPGDRSLALLERACNDDEAAVRESAVLGLSYRPSPKVVATLGRVANHADVETAMLATSRLAAIDTADSLDMLRELAVSHEKTGVRAQAIQSLSAWPIDDVADTLIVCLEDGEAYAGLTETERSAREVLAAAAPQLAANLDEDSTNGIFGPIGETNGRRAARVLQTLTGEDFGYLEASEGEQTEAIEAWRRWRKALHTP